MGFPEFGKMFKQRCYFESSWPKYRVIQVKLANCKWLFETENLDRFLIKSGIFMITKLGNFIWYHKNSEKKISPGTQNIQYIKLNENGNFKMGNLTLTEILSVW